MLRDFEAEQVSVYTSLARKLTGQVAKKLIKNLNAAAGKADQSIYQTHQRQPSISENGTAMSCHSTMQDETIPRDARSLSRSADELAEAFAVYHSTRVRCTGNSKAAFREKSGHPSC